LAGGIIAAIVIGIIVFFLCIPVHLYFRLEAYEKISFAFRLSWLFGLVKRGSGKRKGKPREKARKKGRQNWSFSALLRTSGLAGKLLRLLTDLLRQVKIRGLEVDFEVGLGDPADTVLLVGGIWLATFILGTQTSYPIRVVPTFEDDVVFKGHAHISLRAIPIQLVPAFVRFGFSQPGRKIVKALIFRRWKEKKQ
jgi:hypothetical protein